MPNHLVDRDAETNTLGSLMLAPAIIPDVIAGLEPSDFYAPANQNIYRAIQSIDARGDSPDPILVTDELQKLGLLPEMEANGVGRAYIHSLTNTVPSAMRGKQYAEIVKRYSLNRQLRDLSTRIEHMTQESTDPTEIRAHIADTLDKLEASSFESDLVPIQQTIADHFAHLEQLAKKEKKAGVPTGFHELDALTHGFCDSFLTILAARPAMGKTAFALELAVNVAKADPRAVAIFTLEQAAIELNQRLIAAATGIPGLRLQVADISGLEWQQVSKASADLSALPMFIDDSPMTTLPELRAKCRRLKRKRGLSLVVVDYIQLMPVKGGKDGNREQEVAALSRGLKNLARELQCHVLALSQLNRNAEARQDKRPMLSDLRESGAIEQDADQVLFLYRDEYYVKDSPDAGLVEVNQAKNRHGPNGTFKLAFVKEAGQFKNLPRSPTTHTEPRPHWADTD